MDCYYDALESIDDLESINRTLMRHFHLGLHPVVDDNDLLLMDDGIALEDGRTFQLVPIDHDSNCVDWKRARRYAMAQLCPKMSVHVQVPRMLFTHQASPYHSHQSLQRDLRHRFLIDCRFLIQGNPGVTTTTTDTSSLDTLLELMGDEEGVQLARVYLDQCMQSIWKSPCLLWLHAIHVWMEWPCLRQLLLGGHHAGIQLSVRPCSSSSMDGNSSFVDVGVSGPSAQVEALLRDGRELIQKLRVDHHHHHHHVNRRMGVCMVMVPHVDWWFMESNQSQSVESNALQQSIQRESLESNALQQSIQHESLESNQSQSVQEQSLESNALQQSMQEQQSGQQQSIQHESLESNQSQSVQDESLQEQSDDLVEGEMDVLKAVMGEKPLTRRVVRLFHETGCLLSRDSTTTSSMSTNTLNIQEMTHQQQMETNAGEIMTWVRVEGPTLKLPHALSSILHTSSLLKWTRVHVDTRGWTHGHEIYWSRVVMKRLNACLDGCLDASVHMGPRDACIKGNERMASRGLFVDFVSTREADLVQLKKWMHGCLVLMRQCVFVHWCFEGGASSSSSSVGVLRRFLGECPDAFLVDCVVEGVGGDGEKERVDGEKERTLRAFMEDMLGVSVFLGDEDPSLDIEEETCVERVQRRWLNGASSTHHGITMTSGLDMWLVHSLVADPVREAFLPLIYKYLVYGFGQGGQVGVDVGRGEMGVVDRVGEAEVVVEESKVVEEEVEVVDERCPSENDDAVVPVVDAPVPETLNEIPPNESASSPKQEQGESMEVKSQQQTMDSIWASLDDKFAENAHFDWAEEAAAVDPQPSVTEHRPSSHDRPRLACEPVHHDASMYKMQTRVLLFLCRHPYRRFHTFMVTHQLLGTHPKFMLESYETDALVDLEVDLTFDQQGDQQESRRRWLDIQRTLTRAIRDDPEGPCTLIQFDEKAVSVEMRDRWMSSLNGIASQVLPICARFLPALIGAQGQTIRKLGMSHDVDLDVPWNNARGDEFVNVWITGWLDGIEAGVEEVMALVDRASMTGPRRVIDRASNASFTSSSDVPSRFTNTRKSSYGFEHVHPRTNQQVQQPPPQQQQNKPDLDAPVTSESTILKRVPVARKYFKHIIGPGGCRVIEIRAETGCQILVHTIDGQSVVSITGPSLARVDKAWDMIQEVIKEHDSLGLFERCFNLPVKYHGLIIGKRGNLLRDIKDDVYLELRPAIQSPMDLDIHFYKYPNSDWEGYVEIQCCSQEAADLAAEKIYQRYQELSGDYGYYDQEYDEPPLVEKSNDDVSDPMNSKPVEIEPNPVSASLDPMNTKSVEITTAPFDFDAVCAEQDVRPEDDMTHRACADSAWSENGDVEETVIEELKTLSVNRKETADSGDAVELQEEPLTESLQDLVPVDDPIL